MDDREQRIDDGETLLQRNGRVSVHYVVDRHRHDERLRQLPRPAKCRACRSNVYRFHKDWRLGEQLFHRMVERDDGSIPVQSMHVHKLRATIRRRRFRRVELLQRHQLPVVFDALNLLRVTELQRDVHRRDSSIQQQSMRQKHQRHERTSPHDRGQCIPIRLRMDGERYGFCSVRRAERRRRDGGSRHDPNH